MSPMAVLKLLKEAKKVFDYVHKKNNLDMQMEMVLKRVETLEENGPNDSGSKIKQMQKKIKKLERKVHG